MNKTKRKIFETSMKLFAEKGYDATSIEEITATVGVAKGTLYYHFSSKEEIFKFLVEEGVKLLRNSIEIKTEKITGTIDKIKAIILIQIKVLVKYENFMTIILSEMWGTSERSKMCKGYVFEYIEMIEKIVKEIPAPSGEANKPLKALIFDSYYDAYKGVIIYVRIKEGSVKVGDTIRLMAAGSEFTVVEVGYMDAVDHINSGMLSAGEVGYISASIKSIGETQVGDTVTNALNPCSEPLPGYRKVNPMVYSGIYPADGAKYEDLREALEKLQLNDASLSYEPETSIALGFGFRCGFLGLLHMEIIQERLEREYNLDLITTAPSVIYKVTLTNGETRFIDNPTNYPDPGLISSAEEPMVKAEILAPSDYVGNIMELCQERRGIFRDMKYLDETRVSLHYELPLNEIVYDFFDALKSRTKGYASFDYEILGYAPSKLVKLDILLNGDIVDALSFIVHADRAYSRGRKMVEKLKENIPRQLFEVPIQAAIGGKIIARETVKAMRKDVLAKCYGGDITRKKKLLEKQKEGKKRMRQLGTVEVPQEAFMSVLKLDE